MKKIFALGIIVMLLCTGCGSSVTVTTEQNDLIAEYVSGVLLKYSFEDEWQYTKLKKAQKGTSTSTSSTVKSSTNSTASKANSTNIATSSGNATNTATSSGNSTNTATSSGNSTKSTISNGSTSTTSDPMEMLIEGLGIKGAKITYTNYVVGATYPQGDLVLCVPASTGQKVVAIEFEISNPTATAIVCNTASSKLGMKLLINNEAGISESVTILKNDLINLKNITINPGATYKAVALFMVPDSKANSISSLSISVAVNGGSAASKKLD
ncbi:hypothetical protein [[Clostridium] fimetarium]|nr:hypothetical protein [[Clostridium] fimetarium]